MSFIKYLIVIIFSILIFIDSSQMVIAQSCSGSITCCSSSSIRCTDGTGRSCSPGSDGCDCDDVCDSWETAQQCRLNGSATGCQVSNGCSLSSGTCSFTPPAATPAPTAPPPGSTPGPTPQPGWGSCGSCTASECITAHSRTSPGGCICDPSGCSTPSAPPPFCSLSFSPSSATIVLGEVQRFALTSNYSYCPGCVIDRQGGAGSNRVISPALWGPDIPYTPDYPRNDDDFFDRNFSLQSERGRVNVHTIDLTPIAMGSGRVTAYLGLPDDAAACNAGAAFTVIPPPPWWQVRGAGDVIVNGNIQSLIPRLCSNGESGGTCRDEFIVEDTNSGLPGILVQPIGATRTLRLSSASGGNANIGKPTAEGGAGPSWIAETNVNSIYNYAYFESLASGKNIYNIPGANITGGVIDTAITQGARDADNFVWMRKVGDLTIGNNPLNFNGRKLVIFVDGNLNLNQEVRANDTTNSFVMFIVRGNITVDPSRVGNTVNVSNPNNSLTPNIMGIYWADGQFSTGTTGISNDRRLVMYGSFGALGGVGGTDAFLLQRDLTDGENPTISSEVFTFAPEFIVNFPQTLSDKHLVWREVAP